GAEVVVTARTEEALRDTLEEIRGAGGRVRGVALDVADDASVGSVVPGLVEAYGTIPLLVNNAGITRDNLLLRMKKEDWDEVINTNLTGIYRICRSLVPSMVKARYG